MLKRKCQLRWLFAAGLLAGPNEVIAAEQAVAGAAEAILAKVPHVLPASPEKTDSPANSFILHGDLFGDARHVAVVAVNDGTIIAEAGKEGWKRIAGWPVVAAWVAKGQKREEKGYFHITPPECPFVLKDLDGDRVPELLIAFDEDGFQLGYRIVKKQSDARGLELLTISSIGEPSYRTGYLVTHTATGRKAWGGGDRYYRWVDGAPVLAAESYQNCFDPDRVLYFYARISFNQSEDRFCARNEEGWRISRCKPGAVEGSSDEKPFVHVRFVARTRGVQWPHEAEEAFLFQKLTGLDWRLRTPQPGEMSPDQLGQEFAKFRLEVHGDPEAIGAFNAMPTAAP